MLSSNTRTIFISPLQSRRLCPLQPQDAKKVFSKSPCNSRLETNTISSEDKGFRQNPRSNNEKTRVVFDKNPFYKKGHPQPSINKKVRYKHILSEIGELPKVFDGTKVYDSKREMEASLMWKGTTGGIEVPLTLNTIYVEEKKEVV